MKNGRTKEWLDYCILYVLLNSPSSLAVENPYILCHRYLSSVHFDSFLPFAYSVIDVVCSSASFSSPSPVECSSCALSSRAIAALSVTVLMRKYYGKQPIEPSVQSISDHEFYLCLTIISSSFPELRDTCVWIMATEKQKSGCYSPKHASEPCEEL